MDTNNPVIRFCIAGTQAEFAGRLEDALGLYQQAWEAAQDDYEACIAAHYVARFQATPEGTLRWHQEALERANRVGQVRVKEFYPSLYLNLGRSHEVLGNQSEARRFYELAAALGVVHQVEEPGQQQ